MLLLVLFLLLVEVGFWRGGRAGTFGGGASSGGHGGANSREEAGICPVTKWNAMSLLFSIDGVSDIRV